MSFTHDRIHTAQTLVWVHRAASSCIQAVEDAHSASSDVTSAGLRGKFGPGQYIMQHTACSRQRRDMWVGSFFLVWNASSPIIIKKNLKCRFIFSQILPQVPFKGAADLSCFLSRNSCEKYLKCSIAQMCSLISGRGIASSTVLCPSAVNSNSLLGLG